ncbi:MAG: DNA polymerase III subunit beta [Leptospiraceae bacterium]|nr:MAG: DNA polymerase III subunit beta [Leptospiraceae bacterium]
MEFIINKNELSKALSTVTTITSTKEINEIVSNVLIETENGAISITATDLERSLRDKVPATIIREGSILLPGKKLADLVKGFRYDTMKFIINEGEKVIIQNGNEEQEKKYKTNIEIMGKAPEEFPMPFQLDGLDFISVNPAVIIEMLEKVLYAAAVDDARVVFNGIFVEHKDDLLHFVATDGRRLSLIKRIEQNFLKGNSIIIPSRSVKEIMKLLSNASEVQIAYDENNHQIYIKAGDIYFTSKLIEGSFPDYNQVIPKDQPHKVEIYREEFIDAIKQAMVFAPDPNKQVQLHFKDNLLMVKSATPDLGKVEDGLEINFNGDILIGFNSNYLIDVLEALTCEKVLMTFQSSEAPAMFFDPDDKEFLSIVMPMKIQD